MIAELDVGSSLLAGPFWFAGGLLLGGIVFDVAYQSVSRRPLEIAAFVGPAVAFIVYFTIAASERPLGWPPEIWGGAVITAGFTGLGLVALQNSGRHERLSVPT